MRRARRSRTALPLPHRNVASTDPSHRRAFASRVGCALAITASCCLGFAAGPHREDAPLADDVAFARALAAHRYYDLALIWLDRARAKVTLDAERLVQVATAEATIARLGAADTANANLRRQFFDAAVAHYREALGSDPEIRDVEIGELALDGLAATWIERGRFWLSEQRREAIVDVADEANSPKISRSGAQAAARAHATDSFTQAIDLLRRSRDDLLIAARTSPFDRERLRELATYALYRRGEASFYFALTCEPKEFRHEDQLDHCRTTLTDFLWDAGDLGLLAQSATCFLGAADCEMARGEMVRGKDRLAFLRRHEDALARLLDVVSTSTGVANSILSKKDDPAASDFAKEILERAYLALARLDRDAAGWIESTDPLALEESASPANPTFDPRLIAARYRLDVHNGAAPRDRASLAKALRERAATRALELKGRLDHAGLRPSRDCFETILERAYACAALQRDADAASAASEVARGSPGTDLAAAAQTLLAELVPDRERRVSPSIAGSAELLDLAARGAWIASRRADAIEFFHRCLDAIAASHDPSDDPRFTISSWRGIGDCEAERGRHLESAIAYEQGLAAAERLVRRDEISELAIEAYGAWNRRFQRTHHPFDQAERDRLRAKVTQLGAAPDLQYFAARETFLAADAKTLAPERKAAFAAAEIEFAKVPAATAYRERASVFIARCVEAQGDTARALHLYDEFLKDTPAEPAPSSDLLAQKNHEIALAEATFHRAGILLVEHREQDALKALADFETRFHAQAEFFPHVSSTRVSCFIALRRIEEALSIVDAMLSTPAMTTGSGIPSTRDAVHALAATLADRAHGKDPGATAIPPLAAVDALERAAKLLERYDAATGDSPSLHLRHEGAWFAEAARLALAAGDTSRASDLNHSAAVDFARFQTRFAATEPEVYRDEILPMQARVLLEIDDFGSALPLLQTLRKQRPNDLQVREQLAHCLSGVCERQAGVMVEDFGIDSPLAAIPEWTDLVLALERRGPVRDDAWWRANLGLLHARIRLAKRDEKARADATRLVAAMRTVIAESGTPVASPFRECFEYLAAKGDAR